MPKRKTRAAAAVKKPPPQVVIPLHRPNIGPYVQGHEPTDETVRTCFFDGDLETGRGKGLKTSLRISCFWYRARRWFCFRLQEDLGQVHGHLLAVRNAEKDERVDPDAVYLWVKHDYEKQEQLHVVDFDLGKRVCRCRLRRKS